MKKFNRYVRNLVLFAKKTAVCKAILVRAIDISFIDICIRFMGC